mmetsp:Transcript_21257/g.86941  ORF Transcript_21257/g.86941 Transcript_21257/m.86941 type:complete len:367 (-) Transcript_21257:1283-2383(-)
MDTVEESEAYQPGLALRLEDMAPDDEFPTESSRVQRQVEESFIAEDAAREAAGLHDLPVFQKDRMQAYLRAAVNGKVEKYFVVLDSSQTWLCYWIIHALDLLSSSEEPVLDETTARQTIMYLKSCSNESGGYGGGPGQVSHAATTFAAISALCVIGTDEALESIDRQSLYRFLLRMKQPDGSFSVTDDGEMDIRGTYCALTAAAHTNMLTPEITRGCKDFIASLQSFDGGIGGEAGNESHGGYTYCGLASLCILCDNDFDEMGKTIDLESLRQWASMRQMAFEGGFQGRANKLVDSCYSFWVGALFAMLQEKPVQPSLMDPNRLNRYLINYCQGPKGGMRDKPGAVSCTNLHSQFVFGFVDMSPHY